MPAWPVRRRTRDQAWRILARLNPVFADAHLGILQPEWRRQAQDFLQSGGALFPFEVEVDASGQLFVRMFHFKLLGNGTALLTVNTFIWPDTEAFYAFTTTVFTRLRDEKVKTLLIDVRENGGGNEDMWKEILRHIADKPFRNASTYIKKVIPGRAGAGEQVGDVVHGSASSWVQPKPDNPIRFKGQVYGRVGGATCSSAVLFANVVQDFGFGQVVGAAGHARARQSGGVQSHILPNTGLEVVSPRFILDRPSGLREPVLVLVRPDIVLPDDPFNPQGLVDALMARQRRAD